MGNPIEEQAAAPLNPTPFRALMISAAGELGGAERSLYELLRAMPRSRIEAHACVPAKTPLFKLLQEAGFPVHVLPPISLRRTRNPFTFANQLNALRHASHTIHGLCNKLNIDVVHANSDTAAMAVWRASRMSRRRVPFVWHCRDMRSLHGIGRILSKSSAAVVAISRAVEEHLVSEGVNPVKIRRIENGIELARLHSPERSEEIRAQTRAALGIAADRPVVLSVGAYVPWKRHDLFLQMLARLRSRVPNTIGLLVGSDQFGNNEAHVAELHLLKQELNLGNDVFQALDQREDVPDLMAAADVLVSCSENEPFGRVVAEAGASGLPVVASASGGKIDIVEDGATGLLVEPGKIEPLVAACETLLNDPGLCVCMGLRARERISRLFDVRRTANELLLVMEYAAAGSRHNDVGNLS